MNAFDTFQHEVGLWARKTFPGSTDMAKLKHLQKEVVELMEAHGDRRKEEAADCLLILMHFAEAHGFSLLGAARDKHEINRKRRWGKPDKDGVIEHIRD